MAKAKKAQMDIPDVNALMAFLETLPKNGRPDINTNDGYMKLLDLYKNRDKEEGEGEEEEETAGPRTVSYGILIKDGHGKVMVQAIEDMIPQRKPGQKGKLDPNHPDEVFKRRKAMQAAMMKGRLVRVVPV